MRRREVRKLAVDEYVVIRGNDQHFVNTTSVTCSCGGAPLCIHYQGVKAILDAEGFIHKARITAGRA